jgi:hypothetical protein
MVNKTLTALLALVIASVALSGCEAIAGIFKAGMWTGVILVVLVVVIVIWIISKLFSRNKGG